MISGPDPYDDGKYVPANEDREKDDETREPDQTGTDIPDPTKQEAADDNTVLVAVIIGGLVLLVGCLGYYIRRKTRDPYVHDIAYDYGKIQAEN